jgi:hypothetical protein
MRGARAEKHKSSARIEIARLFGCPLLGARSDRAARSETKAACYTHYTGVLVTECASLARASIYLCRTKRKTAAHRPGARVLTAPSGDAYAHHG